MLDFNFNTTGLSRLIETLEKSPKVLGLLYFLAFILLVYVIHLFF